MRIYILQIFWLQIIFIIICVYLCLNETITQSLFLRKFQMLHLSIISDVSLSIKLKTNF